MLSERTERSGRHALGAILLERLANKVRVIEGAATAVVALGICLAAGYARGAELELAVDGRSDYQIVVADNAAPATRYAAEELQHFLAEMTGAALPIVSDQQPAAACEIVIGANAHQEKLAANLNLRSLGPEGYVIRTVDQSLLIAGSDTCGNLNGAYGFLQDHLGCRWFAPGVSRIPKSARLAIAAIDDRQIPRFSYREMFLCDCFLDGDWMTRNRLNATHGDIAEKHGRKVRFGAGFDCHTFERLVPPDEYFETHPEYFALVAGERRKERQEISAQLCCTNEEVIRICTDKIRTAMREQPWANVFSVSQNDSYEPTPENERYEPGVCECEKCQELVRREGTQAAPVLHLVNRVAEAVEEEFPDKLVSTLAYQWTRHPPKEMRPRKNVLIWLCCSGWCCCSHPLETCDGASARALRADLEGWSKIASHLWMWDYVANFPQYLLPLPTHRVFTANIRFFAAHNVEGVFVQDAGDTLEGELAELSGYTAAQALWNPYGDPDRVMNEFLAGYYGGAAAPIREYIDLLHDRVQVENIHVSAFSYSDSPHLTTELLVKANDLWGQAEELVAAEPEVLARVKRSRMSVDFAILERARLQAQQALPADRQLPALAAARLKPFLEALQASKITRLLEGAAIDKEAYGRELATTLGLPLD